MIGSQKTELKCKLAALDRFYATIEFELDGTILTANNNFLSVMDYKLEEIQGKKHSMFVDADYAKSKEYQMFWDKLRSGEAFFDQFPRLGKGGKRIWIQASYTPVTDRSGRPYKVIKLAKDVTEEKLQALEYEGCMTALAKSQAIICFELDGTILDANEAFLKATGYQLDEIKGKHHSIFVSPKEVESDEYRQFWQNLRQGRYDAGEYKRIGKKRKTGAHPGILQSNHG